MESLSKLEQRKQSVRNAIEALQSEVECRIKWLNHGGCGIFALMVHRELSKYGIRSEMRVINRKHGGEDKFNEAKQSIEWYLNEEYFNEHELRETSFSHSYIELPDFDIIFDGEVSDEDLKDEWLDEHSRWDDFGEYTPEEMEVAIKHGGWNDFYKRSQNDLLQEIIEVKLKENL